MTMLEQIAAAIEKAMGEEAYYVKLFHENAPPLNGWCVLHGGSIAFAEIIFTGTHADCEKECVRLTNLYIARKAVEAMREISHTNVPQLHFEICKKEGCINSEAVFSFATWERTIDAILEEHKI
jgi:hypothetical protein